MSEKQLERMEYGVLESNVVDNYYHVKIRWKDGQETERRFPVNGFSVMNPETQEELGRLSGQQALRILQEEAGKQTSKEFSWQRYV